ncbi:MAG: hypothetical protein SH856_09950 [Flavobacteriales bacterium]|nr:hypothetical protein [Flavobacteriales bacterium]
MKSILLIISSFVIFGFAFPPYNRKACDEKHFLIFGNVYEYDPFIKGEKLAPKVQVVVYQDNDIFVSFYTDKNGMYQFNLPLGHTYELWYGGSKFVNKICFVDAKDCPERKVGNELDMDVGLFQPIDGCDFTMLNEPFIRVDFDKEMNKLVPDLDYIEDRSHDLDKVFRKARRAIE